MTDASVGTLDLDGLRALLDRGAQLVEVLPHEEYDWGHLPGALHIPLKQLAQESTSLLDKRRPVAVYCWDALCDMSPRAACRLATLGFTEVYDYVAGKVDWIAHGLALEGEWDQAAAIGAFAHRDAVTCRLQDRAGLVRGRIEASPYGFALVLSAHGVVLGRVRSSALTAGEDVPIEALMEPGPSTVRAHVQAAELAGRLTERDLATAIVTTPGGRLLGVVCREELRARPNAAR
jgi:rhodanese-related sulfurtransferase